MQKYQPSNRYKKVGRLCCHQFRIDRNLDCICKSQVPCIHQCPLQLLFDESLRQIQSHIFLEPFLKKEVNFRPLDQDERSYLNCECAQHHPIVSGSSIELTLGSYLAFPSF